MNATNGAAAGLPPALAPQPPHPPLPSPSQLQPVPAGPPSVSAAAARAAKHLRCLQLLHPLAVRPRVASGQAVGGAGAAVSPAKRSRLGGAPAPKRAAGAERNGGSARTWGEQEEEALLGSAGGGASVVGMDSDRRPPAPRCTYQGLWSMLMQAGAAAGPPFFLPHTRATLLADTARGVTDFLAPPSLQLRAQHPCGGLKQRPSHTQLLEAVAGLCGWERRVLSYIVCFEVGDSSA